jgi:hypothetical protein
MSIKSRAAVVMAVAVVVLAICAALPRMFLPKRWLEIHPGMTREQVLAVLGLPDDDDFGGKNRDEWSNAFYVGASAMLVHYDKNDLVDRTVFGTFWGFRYRTVDHDYRRELSVLRCVLLNPPPASLPRSGGGSPSPALPRAVDGAPPGGAPFDDPIPFEPVRY